MSQRGSKTGNFCSRVAHVPSFTMIIDRLTKKWLSIEELIKKNEDYIKNLNNQIDSLNGRISSTYSIQKKIEIKSWIDKKVIKIEEVSQKNLTLESEIELIRNKIIYYKKL